MLFFIGQVLPYIACAIFLIGMIGKIVGWLKVPVPFHLTLSPSPQSMATQTSRLGNELLFFKSLFKYNGNLWFWAWIMHVSLALVIIGHIVGIYFLMEQFTLIGFSPAESKALSSGFGTVAGVVLLIGLLALLFMRMSDPLVRRLSDGADFFDLFLVLAVVITGNHMRLPSVHVDLEPIRTYLGNLIFLHPTPIPDNLIFITHFTCVLLLLMYFPFSKFVHMVGFLVNRWMLLEKGPVHPTPAGTSFRSSFAKQIKKADPTFTETTVKEGDAK